MQHVKRQRENRLFGLVLRHPGRLGIARPTSWDGRR